MSEEKENKKAKKEEDNENKQEDQKEVKKVTFGSIFAWLFGGLMLLVGFTWIFTNFIVGVLALIMACVVLPPFNRKILEEKLNIQLSTGLKIIIVIILFALIGAALPSEGLEYEPVNSEPSQTETDTKNESESSNEEVVEEENEWIKVTELVANNDKQGDTFSLEGGKQRVVYNVTSEYPNMAMCSVYVLEEGHSLSESGGFPTVMIDKATQDETMMRKSKGDYYLDLTVANASCEIEIYELR